MQVHLSPVPVLYATQGATFILLLAQLVPFLLPTDPKGATVYTDN